MVSGTRLDENVHPDKSEHPPNAPQAKLEVQL